MFKTSVDKEKFKIRTPFPSIAPKMSTRLEKDLLVGTSTLTSRRLDLASEGRLRYSKEEVAEDKSDGEFFEVIFF